ncbi:DUF2829 domain-containing protein [Candidatus Pacearchaeota archaeon]|nr:DUF2829 domain-containing protein [Candidatus Pacearchaeota archaeon]
MKYNFRIYENGKEELVAEGESDTPKGCVDEAVRLLNKKEIVVPVEEKKGTFGCGLDSCPDINGWCDDCRSRKAKEANMGFEEALKALKMGNKTRRVGWNGFFVEMQELMSFDSERQLLRPFFTKQDKKSSVCDTRVPSTEDLLANDWMVEV